LPKTSESLKICFGAENENTGNRAIKVFQAAGIVNQESELEEKIRKLEEELYTVKMERDILKKAVAIFSKPQK